MKRPGLCGIRLYGGAALTKTPSITFGIDNVLDRTYWVKASVAFGFGKTGRQGLPSVYDLSISLSPIEQRNQREIKNQEDSRQGEGEAHRMPCNVPDGCIRLSILTFQSILLTGTPCPFLLILLDEVFGLTPPRVVR